MAAPNETDAPNNSPVETQNAATPSVAAPNVNAPGVTAAGSAASGIVASHGAPENSASASGVSPDIEYSNVAANVANDESGENAESGAPDAEKIGTAVGNRIGTYEIRAILGRGGNAEVYKAWHIYLQRLEAIKVLLPHAVHDISFVQRFLREARTAANLHHPHIATIFTVSVPETAQPYFTMELLEGGDVATLIEREGQLPLDETISILRQVASALDYAHDHGVIHRDVKPANILLRTDDGSARFVKVVDFGIARAQEEVNGARLTKTGLIVGTPEYMSPEQAGSGPKVDHRTDVYSLGVVAYEMLCGRPPFEEDEHSTPLTVIMKHVREDVRPPKELRTDLSPRINNAILKALAKNPEERFISCGEFVDALGRGSASGVFVAPPIAKAKKSRKEVVLPSQSAAVVETSAVAAPNIGTSSTRSDVAAPTAITPSAKKKSAWLMFVVLATLLAVALAAWNLTRHAAMPDDETNVTSNSVPAQATPLVTPTETPATSNTAIVNAVTANVATPSVATPTPKLVATPQAALTPKAIASPKAIATPKIAVTPKAVAAPKLNATPIRKVTPRVTPRATPRSSATSSTRSSVIPRRRVRRSSSAESTTRPRRTRVRRERVRVREPRRRAIRQSTVRRSAPRHRAPRRTTPSSALPF